MIYDVVDYRTQLPAIKTREGGRNSNQGRYMTSSPFGRVSQTKVFQGLQIGGTDDMMCLVYKYKLVA